ncbi:hypothetical protein VA596_11930 [Amycolatopsis sp., V23-08]|uniref:2'-5' RNA ligase family protein n=1 Tax=Amycolatopsis heterodermiae TaxID=3110235 RepID=A0ABU5R4K8_9PSEU|nr:hypothetical protein [Amycolatopsis sp., V23-08]MEA5360246.1 hypothetical protein [Amycolatopsis sp., V23-08]
MFEARDEPLGQLVNQVRALPPADAIGRHWCPHLALAYTRANCGILDAVGINHVCQRWAWQLDALHVAVLTPHPPTAATGGTPRHHRPPRGAVEQR